MEKEYQYGPIENYLFIKGYDIDLTNCLGKGTFSKVYSAYCQTTKTEYAVKIIPRTNVKTHEQYEKLDREINNSEIAANHPGVPMFYDYFQDSENHYLVFEKLEGLELYEYLDKCGKLDETTTRNLFRKVLDIVSYIHSRHMCHRDIKIENIIVSKDLTKLHLIDFGFSIITKRGENLNERCGSYYNYPPEICGYKKYDGYKYDIWTLGNLLYIMLSAKRPFTSSNRICVENLLFPQGVEYHPINGISDEAQDLIRILFTFDPRERPSIEEIFNHPWVKKSE